MRRRNAPPAALCRQSDGTAGRYMTANVCTVPGIGADCTGNSLSEYLQKAEKFAIEDALEEANGIKSKAAAILGIHRTQLYRKMKKLDIGES